MGDCKHSIARDVFRDFMSMAYILRNGTDAFIHENAGQKTIEERMKRAAYCFASATMCTQDDALRILDLVGRILSCGMGVEFIIGKLSKCLEMTGDE